MALYTLSVAKIRPAGESFSGIGVSVWSARPEGCETSFDDIEQQHDDLAMVGMTRHALQRVARTAQRGDLVKVTSEFGSDLTSMEEAASSNFALRAEVSILRKTISALGEIGIRVEVDHPQCAAHSGISHALVAARQAVEGAQRREQELMSRRAAVAA
jgi:hypothetical protein